MRTGHPAVMPSAITEARKTARGWIEEQVRSKNNCGSKSGYLSNSGTRSPPPQRSAVICTVRSLWSSLCCPQSLVIPVLSAVSGHPCAVRSLWSSL
ncbi:unnamed protein product, partial [Staurois parvus]